MVPGILRVIIKLEQRFIVAGRIIRVHLGKRSPLPQKLCFFPLSLGLFPAEVEAVQQRCGKAQEHRRDEHLSAHGAEALLRLPAGKSAQPLQIAAHILQLVHIRLFRRREIHRAAVRAIGKLRGIIGSAASADDDWIVILLDLHVAVPIC